MTSEEDGGILRRFNWPGLLAGVLMLLLPFTGTWWNVTGGTVLFSLSLSPFLYEFMVMGETMTVPILNYVVLALQILVFFGGLMLIAGSIMQSEKGRKLLKYGSGKVIWPTVMFFIVLVLGAFLINNYMTGFMPIDGAEEIQEEPDVDINVPYLVGTSTTRVQLENMEASFPVTKSFQSPILLGILAMSLALVSRRFSDLIS